VTYKAHLALQLDPELKEQLRREAKKLGISMNALAVLRLRLKNPKSVD
jgi:predicted HicB family RNase H-like nuclease